MRFKLPREDSVLGVNMGQRVRIGGERDWGEHNPISGFDTLGFADFLVPESHSLSQVKEGESVQVEGPIERITYLGNGHFTFPSRQDRQCKYLGMVVQGNDLTKVFQIVESISTSKDSTFLSVLYVVESLEEAALIEELAFFRELDKVHINVLV